jgi:hypothetical protein
LAIPGTIAPRYGNPADSGLQPQQEPTASLFAEYPLALSITVAFRGAWTVKGASRPGLKLGSTSQGQLDNSATSRQAKITVPRPGPCQDTKAWRGRSSRSSCLQSRFSG